MFKFLIVCKAQRGILSVLEGSLGHWGLQVDVELVALFQRYGTYSYWSTNSWEIWLNVCPCVYLQGWGLVLLGSKEHC
jgi:hypothetical protein